MRIRALVPAAVAVLALAAACSGSGSDGDDAAPTTEATTTTIQVDVPDDAVETDRIAIGDEGFDPPVVVVEAGATVSWANEGTTTHTATADDEGGFDTGAIAAGDALALTVAEPGVHTYHCDLHPDLTATLVVTP